MAKSSILFSSTDRCYCYYWCCLHYCIIDGLLPFIQCSCAAPANFGTAIIAIADVPPVSWDESFSELDKLKAKRLLIRRDRHDQKSDEEVGEEVEDASIMVVKES